MNTVNTEILHAADLTVGYGDQTVVRDICLHARSGQILSLIGPNGAGKSTILKTLIRELQPLGGTVVLSGKELSSFGSAELARCSAAVLTERPRPELMRCEDVVASGRYPYTGRLGILSASDRETVRSILRLTGLESIAQQDFDRISDGQRQRVMLARALCQEPKLLVLDEPTSFLDIRHKLEFLHLLRSLARERQIAVVMSMHELDLAQKYSDVVACVRKERIERIGPPEEIFSGRYISELYAVEHGFYDPCSGAMEPEGNHAPPQVFVIGGGGSGIPVYRRLWRMGVPFAVGVLQENDLDYPTAAALASLVITERAFEPISPARQAQASALMQTCRYVLCPLEHFGSMNRCNETLRQEAEARGLLRRVPTEC